MTDTAPGTGTPTTSLDRERHDLLAALAQARAALTRSVQGLSTEQLGARPTAGALCLGGLVKHVTSVEQGWLRFVVEGPSAMAFDLPDGVSWDDLMAGTARELPGWMTDREREFRMQPGDTLEGILARYEQAAARTDELVRGVADLSAAQPLPEAPWSEPGEWRSVRRVLLHVIAETTQHAGHADILRETIDGAVA